MTSPKLAVEQPDGSRLYVHPVTDEKVPSVTTIIKEAIAKPFLMKWATRLGAEYADGNWDALSQMSSWARVSLIKTAHERERDGASELGTAVHSALDAWAKGEPHEYSKEVSPFMTSFTKFIMEMRPEFLYSEVTLWSRTHGYAGTADAICKMRNGTFLIDYKTGKSLHSEVALQLTALAYADFIITDEGDELELPDIGTLAAIHIRPRSWHVAEIDHKEESWHAFLACRELYSWIHECSESVLRKVA